MKAPERRKVYHLSVRVTAKERDWLQEMAKICDVKPSDVARAAIAYQMRDPWQDAFKSLRELYLQTIRNG